MKKLVFVLALLLTFSFLAAGCGKKDNKPQYEVVDGHIVEVGTDAAAGDDAGDDALDNASDYTASPQHQAGEHSVGSVSDGVSYSGFGDEEYNTIDQTDGVKISSLEDKLNQAVEACREIYENADKGGGVNVSLSDSSVYEMISALGQSGFSAVDSRGEFNMVNYEQMDDFGMSASLPGNTEGTYFVVYPDGHLSLFDLYRENSDWHLISMSYSWDSSHIYSKGRYAIGGVKYTLKGWLIYTRDTTDFDDNQKANTGEYTMVRVLPYDQTCRDLCRKYVEPVGYLENNLFTTTWSEANFGPIDFNSLYSYIFAMCNGTDMLSSYNVRTYYKSVAGTRLYLIPTYWFELNTQTYFNIDSTALKGISDYSYELDGYFFLGYNRDYYNVTPRTPKPEVISYRTNADGSITMVVEAVNEWYGTDCAFRHTLTVMPRKTGFKYMSNTIEDSPNNIIPDAKLSEMLNVERAKTNY